MTRPPKYPLEALGEVRARRVDAGAEEVARAIGAREAAELQRARAEAARTRVEAEGERVRRTEKESLARGELTAADLARGAAWEVAAREEAARHREQLERAASAAQAAYETEARAKEDLAARKSEADVVEKDRAKWKARETKRVLDREEESAEEAWRRKA